MEQEANEEEELEYYSFEEEYERASPERREELISEKVQYILDNLS